MADNILYKSFLFEVVDSNYQIKESFTLVIPPTAVTVNEKQRVAVTKTFGNVFVDDYGPDNIELMIKGFSGTAKAWPTFSTKGISGNTPIGTVSMDGYDQRSAFYEFRDNIARYKDKYPDTYDRMELRVYDLNDEQGYRCVLQNFNMERNAQQPFRYNFTIQLLAYGKLDSPFTPIKPVLIGTSNLFALMDNISENIDAISDSGIFTFFSDIGSAVSKFKSKLTTMATSFVNLFDDVGNLIVSPVYMVKSIIEDLGVILSVTNKLYEKGAMVYDTYSEMTEVWNDSFIKLNRIFGQILTVDSIKEKTVVIPKNAGMDAGVPSNTPSTYTYNSVYLYLVKEGDSLQSIAQVQLGDLNLYPFISDINNLYSNEDLTVGLWILIPIQIQADAVAVNHNIISSSLTANPYGVDISIDALGNLIILESGAVALVTDMENIIQAITRIIHAVPGSMITNMIYGLTSQIGSAGTAMSMSYLKMHIKASIIQDARIRAVNNLVLSFSEDVVQVFISVSLVSSDTVLDVSTQIGGSV